MVWYGTAVRGVARFRAWASFPFMARVTLLNPCRRTTLELLRAESSSTAILASKECVSIRVGNNLTECISFRVGE